MPKSEIDQEKANRFRLIREELGFDTQEEFGVALGNAVNLTGKPIDPSSISKCESGKLAIPQKVVVELISHYKMNKTWWETGKGDMLLDGAPTHQTGKSISDKKAFGVDEEEESKKIPFFDADAVGGLPTVAMDMQPIREPAGDVDIGDFLRDCDAAMRVYGNSMTTGYPPGCVIGLKLNEDGVIIPGNVYVIETVSNRLVKRLYMVENGFKCISDNNMKFEEGPMKGEFYYPPFIIPFEKIIRIHEVVGVIKRNTNQYL